MDPITIGSSLLWGALGGVGWGIVGYVSNKSKDTKTEFELKYFAKSVLVGAGFGIYAAYTGMPIDGVAASAAAVPITGLVEKIVTVIWNALRLGKNKLSK